MSSGKALVGPEGWPSLSWCKNVLEARLDFSVDFGSCEL